MKKLFVFLILFFSQLSFSSEGVDLNCSQDQDNCIFCDNDLTIFPLREFNKDLNSLDIEANNSEITGSEI